MPRSFVPLTPVQITTLGVNYNWGNVDVNALVPAGATGAILYVEHINPAVRNWCVRPKGSTHTLGLQSMGGSQHCYTMVGLDINGVFEFNNVSAFPAKVQLYLVGYTMLGAEFLPELVDISPAAPHLIWYQINLGPAGLNLIPATAIGVMVDVFAYGGVRNYGLRMNGSTDNRTTALTSERSNGVQVVGCDANQIIEGYRPDVGTRLFLVGYITAGAAFLVNGLDVSPAALGITLPLGGGLPTTAVIAFLEIAGPAGRYFLDDVIPGAARYLSSTQHVATYCPTDDWRGRLENAAQIFALGYSLYVVPVVTTDPATSIISNAASLNGTLDDDGGLTCDCGFEWGETAGPPYDSIVTLPGTYVTGQTFAQTLYPLRPNTTYYFRAFATNDVGTSYGAQRSFTTLRVPYYASLISPNVQTNPATDITEHAARLNGVVVEDGGIIGAVRFQWGLTTEYGNNTSWQQGYGKGDEFFVDLNNLAEGQGFHFRAQFRVGGNLVSGRDMVFNTLSPVGPVTLVTDEIIQLLETV